MSTNLTSNWTTIINEGVIHTLFTGSYHAEGNDGYSVFGTITDKKNADINDTPTFV